MSYDILIWLHQSPNPEHVAAFMSEMGFRLDDEPWSKDLDDHDFLTMRSASHPKTGPRFHCFFGPVSDPINPKYVALAMFCVGLGYAAEQAPTACELAEEFAAEFEGRVRDPQIGEWIS